jgi:hypothetical protein
MCSAGRFPDPLLHISSVMAFSNPSPPRSLFCAVVFIRVSHVLCAIFRNFHVVSGVQRKGELDRSLWSAVGGVTMRRLRSLHGRITLQLLQHNYRTPEIVISVSAFSLRPPPWSSGQSSWLQIQRSGFDFRIYHIF